jgi:hypothetical protein
VDVDVNLCCFKTIMALAVSVFNSSIRGGTEVQSINRPTYFRIVIFFFAFDIV